MGAIIDIDHLSKEYGSGTKALDDVTLSIDEGEIIALLGPNGAGKTTLISIICGLVVPTGGTVRVGGHDIRTDWRAARKLIGLVPQEIALEPFEKVINCVRFTRGLYGMPPDEAYIERILRSLSLWDKRDAATRELSGGMKRRVLIAKALSHQPKVLFLDEPTAGVDVALRREMWQVVGDLRREGVTIILTTHYLEEAEQMCDEIAIINHGQVVVRQSTQDLLSRTDGKTLVLDTGGAVPHPPLPAGARPETRPDGRLAITYPPSRLRADQILDAVRAAGVPILDVAAEQPDLEDVFVELTRD